MQWCIYEISDPELIAKCIPYVYI